MVVIAQFLMLRAKISTRYFCRDLVSVTLSAKVTDVDSSNTEKYILRNVHAKKETQYF